MKQAELKSGTTYTTLWLEGQECKVGDKVRLKHDNRLWDVIKLYEMNRFKSELNRSWRVGGMW